MESLQPTGTALLDTALTPEVMPPLAEEIPHGELSPQQIADFSRRFRDDSVYQYRLWRLCSDAVDGFKHYLQSDPSVRGGYEMAHFYRARDISFNITQPLLRTVRAMLAIARPEIGADPGTMSLADIAAAQACSLFWNYDFQRGNYGKKFNAATNICAQYGTAVILTTWVNGDPELLAVTPEYLRAEPGLSDPDDSRFMGVIQIKDKGSLIKRFPDKSEQIRTGPVAQRLTSAWGLFQDMAPDRIEVMEVYTRDGHFYYMLNDSCGTVLEHKLVPPGARPIQMIRYTDVADQWWGMGVVEMMLPAQYAYSAAINQILRNARYMADPKILIPRQSKIRPDAFVAGRAGEKIEYDMKEPSMLTPSPIPQYLAQLAPQMQASGFDSAGIHGVSTGKRMIDIESGAAVNAMANKDAAQLRVTTDNFKFGYEATAKNVLIFRQAYGDPMQTITQFDRYGSGMAQELKVSRLAQNPNVFFEADTLFAMDVEARQTRIMQMMQSNSLPADIGLKALQTNTDPLRPVKNVQDYVDGKKALDAVIVNGFEITDPRGGVDPATGQPLMRKVVKVYPSDNIQMFADVAKEYIRSDEFNAMPLDRQDAVDQYYEYLLGLLTPAAALPPPGQPGSGQAPPPRLSLPPGAPAQPKMPGQVSLPAATAAARAGDKAEGAQGPS